MTVTRPTETSKARETCLVVPHAEMESVQDSETLQGVRNAWKYYPRRSSARGHQTETKTAWENMPSCSRECAWNQCQY